jgi:hypothetical protein
MASRHLGKSCDCIVSCFLCREKGRDGACHGALSSSCPLKAAFRMSHPPSQPSPAASAARVDDVPSDVVTVPPTPITEDTKMVTDPAVLATLTSLAGPSAIATSSPLNA